MAKHIIIKGTPVVGANEILVADSNSKIPAVDGSAVTTMAGGNITGTIPTARLDTGTTANKVVVLGASGLPAVDGSLLTGIVSHTTSASDPAIDTNPSGGVGTEWINSTSGKQYICTDATTDENVWINVGAGTGDIQPYVFGGESYGFCAAGRIGGSDYSDIDRYSFTSDGAGTNVGDATNTMLSAAGAQSVTNGYIMGGFTYSGSVYYDTIDTFSFSSLGTASDIGNLTQSKHWVAGHSSADNAYCTGGSTGSRIDVIDKVSFSSDGNSDDIGNLTVTRERIAGCSSVTHGYAVSGYTGSASDVIDKFSFSSDSDATDVGNSSVATHSGGGCSSGTHGYHGCGYNNTNEIGKFSFSSDSDAVDIGNATVGRGDGVSGTSSLTYGYLQGGYIPPDSNVIEKFSFSSDGDATDVGDLSQAHQGGSAQHV